MIPWYNLSEQERIEIVYSQYTIKDFWYWWSGGEQKVMEVRIKDFPLIKDQKTYINKQKYFSNSIKGQK